MKKLCLFNFETTDKESFIGALSMQKWLQSDHKQRRYLTQKVRYHQIRIRIFRCHFQSQIFTEWSFRNGSFSVIWKTRTGLLISAVLNSRSLLITWWLYFENGILCHYFSKATVIVDVSGLLVGWLCWGLTSQSTIFQSCRDGAIASWVINQYFQGVKCLAQGHNTAAVGLEPRTSRSGVRVSGQNIYKTISLITSWYTNMYQLFIFIQTFSRYQRHDIHVSIDIITLLMLRNELYPSQFTKNNIIGHHNWR